MNKKMICVRELDKIETKCTVEKRHINKEHIFPLHWHDYFECEIVLSGNGTHICNGHQYEVSAGDCWLMSFYDFHTVVPSADTELMHICFERGFLLPELEQLIQTTGFCCHIKNSEWQEIVSSCDTLLSEQKNRARFWEVSQKAILSRLMTLLLRNAESHPSNCLPLIGTSLAYMHEHFREDLSMEKVAQIQNLSSNYFGALFKNAIGISFRDYLNKLRLKYACDLLSSSDLSIKEVAFASGYASIEYFFYVFKKHLSITPSAYRMAKSISN